MFWPSFVTPLQRVRAELFSGVLLSSYSMVVRQNGGGPFLGVPLYVGLPILWNPSWGSLVTVWHVQEAVAHDSNHLAGPQPVESFRPCIIEPCVVEEHSS